LLLLPTVAAAHFNILLPQTPSAQRGKAVEIVYQWGHPFEHQLFDAPVPASCMAVAPDGRKTDLSELRQKIAVPSGSQQVTAYRYRFTPEERGDYRLYLETPPIWLPEDQEFVQDSVKVILHVQAQVGWDAAAGQAFEMFPLTRPYGLQPGMAFQAQVMWEKQPLANTQVEIERYHPAPPRELPPDEQRTRVSKTDPNGVVTATLTEPGWWCLTASREAGTRMHEGKKVPLRRRTTLWVYVAEKK
jgi:cobalt/nickel transport protein